MKSRSWIFLSMLLTAAPAMANVSLPAIFSDNMVLQKAAKVPIWGTADAGEPVKVEINGVTANATADDKGAWKANLDLSQQAAGPFTMTVTGKNTLTVNNVVIGQVWLCSGQSNMEFTVSGAINAPAEIAASTNSMIRQFHVVNNTSKTPITELRGKWEMASPETTGHFTAAGYFFARDIQKALNVPVGLVHSSWGGTPAEAWTSLPALEANPELKTMADQQIAALDQVEQQRKTYAADLAKWEQDNARSDPGNKGFDAGNADPATATTDWKTIQLPGNWRAAGLPVNGVVWVRRDVDLPDAWNGKGITLELGPVADYEVVYFNNKRVGAVNEDNPGYARQNRGFRIPGALVKTGKNTLALRIFTPSGMGGVSGRPDQMRLNAGPTGSIPLAGDWLAKVEAELTPASPAINRSRPRVGNAQPQNTSSCLYNAMINPLAPYALAGALWYQGENNAGRAYQYRTLFPTMINNWRQAWGQGDFPFYFCQLANFMAKKPDPGDSAWAELREAQSMTLKLPNTAQAMLIDLGEEGTIHPRDKQDVGHRLALAALANVYGKDNEYSGPVYQTMAVEGNKIRLKFTHLGGGLVAKELPATYAPMSAQPDKTVPLVLPSLGSPLQGFTICGEDKKWVWANAAIDGDTVLVSADAVPHPIAVRYAWADNPTCNLYNKAGLPATPFRTDDFPGVTQGKG